MRHKSFTKTKLLKCNGGQVCCKYLGIIFIKIVGYTSLGNGWIDILTLSGVLEPCINSSGKAALFQTFLKAESISQDFFKEDIGL